MQKYLAFLAIGSFFSTIEEFLTIVAVRHDKPTFVFTTIIVWPVVLSIVYWTSRLLDRRFPTEQSREVAHLVVYGAVGLLTEWFLMAPHLAPWRMLGQAPVLLVLLFQLGMCAFWTTVTTAPRLFLNADESHRRTRKRILRFYLPFFLVVYAIVFAIPDRARLWPTVWLIVLGHLIVNAIMIFGWRRAEHAGAVDRARQTESPAGNGP